MSGKALAAGFERHRRLARNATYFVAARREPSGITVGKPGGLRRSANKNAPNGPKVSGIGRQPLENSHHLPASPVGAAGAYRTIPVAPPGLCVSSGIQGLTPLATTCRPYGTEESAEGSRPEHVLQTPSCNKFLVDQVICARSLTAAAQDPVLVCGRAAGSLTGLPSR